MSEQAQTQLPQSAEPAAKPPTSAPTKPKRIMPKPIGNRFKSPASVTDDPANLEAYIQAATREVLGEPVRAVAMEQGMVREQARRVGTICGASIEEFREKVRGKAQEVLDLLGERMPKMVESLKPMETFVAYGITMDKYRDLTGGTAPTSVHVTNIQVNGASRGEAMAMLTGARNSPQARQVMETESFPVATRTAANATL